MRISLILALMLLSCSVSCSISPTTAELTGKWTISTARSQLPTEVRDASGTIDLNPDGTFSATELPLLFGDGKHNPLEVTSGSGTWQLGDWQGQGAQIQLLFSTVSEGGMGPVFPGQAKPPLPYGCTIHIGRASIFGHHKCLYYIAWPNEIMIAFEKKT